MSNEQLTQEAMSLPISERIALAQSLWESIEQEIPDDDEQAVIDEAIRRDNELTSGADQGCSYEEAIEAARRAIGCV